MSTEKTSAGPLVLAAAFVAAAGFSGEISAAVSEAVNRCLNIIIPSLFAVMALSQLLISGRGAKVLAIPFYPVRKLILPLDSELFTLFIISVLSGYPVGLRLISQLYRQGRIDKSSAENMCCFCYCGGPAFYCGAVGRGVFGDSDVGWLIFVSIFLSDLLVGAVMTRLHPFKVRSCASSSVPGAEALTDAVTDTGRALFGVCMMIMFCSALMAVPEAAGVFDLIHSYFNINHNTLTLIKACFEISFLTQLRGTPYGLLPEITAVCTMGGGCIILQLIALKDRELSLKKFLLTRLPAAIISAVFCSALSPLFVGVAKQASTQSGLLVNFNNFIPSICLISMIFLLNLKKGLVFSE